MEQLIELARRLGRQMAAHERTTLFKKTQKAVNDDTEVSQLIKDYQSQVQKISQLEQQKKPVEVEDKHKLSDIEAKLSTSSKMNELTRRQADFVEMMNKVKKAIDQQLQMDE